METKLFALAQCLMALTRCAKNLKVTKVDIQEYEPCGVYAIGDLVKYNNLEYAIIQYLGNNSYDIIPSQLSIVSNKSNKVIKNVKYDELSYANKPQQLTASEFIDKYESMALFNIVFLCFRNCISIMPNKYEILNNSQMLVSLIDKLIEINANIYDNPSDAIVVETIHKNACDVLGISQADFFKLIDKSALNTINKKRVIMIMKTYKLKVDTNPVVFNIDKLKNYNKYTKDLDFYQFKLHYNDNTSSNDIYIKKTIFSLFDYDYDKVMNNIRIITNININPLVQMRINKFLMNVEYKNIAKNVKTPLYNNWAQPQLQKVAAGGYTKKHKLQKTKNKKYKLRYTKRKGGVLLKSAVAIATVINGMRNDPNVQNVMFQTGQHLAPGAVALFVNGATAMNEFGINVGMRAGGHYITAVPQYVLPAVATAATGTSLLPVAVIGAAAAAACYWTPVCNKYVNWNTAQLESQDTLEQTLNNQIFNYESLWNEQQITSPVINPYESILNDIEADIKVLEVAQGKITPEQAMSHIQRITDNTSELKEYADKIEYAVTKLPEKINSLRANQTPEYNNRLNAVIHSQSRNIEQLVESIDSFASNYANTAGIARIPGVNYDNFQPQSKMYAPNSIDLNSIELKRDDTIYDENNVDTYPFHEEPEGYIKMNPANKPSTGLARIPGIKYNNNSPSDNFLTIYNQINAVNHKLYEDGVDYTEQLGITEDVTPVVFIDAEVISLEKKIEKEMKNIERYKNILKTAVGKDKVYYEKQLKIAQNALHEAQQKLEEKNKNNMYSAQSNLDELNEFKQAYEQLDEQLIWAMIVMGMIYITTNVMIPAGNNYYSKPSKINTKFTSDDDTQDYGNPGPSDKYQIGTQVYIYDNANKRIFGIILGIEHDGNSYAIRSDDGIILRNINRDRIRLKSSIILNKLTNTSTVTSNNFASAVTSNTPVVTSTPKITL